jgi:hypothetical protein
LATLAARDRIATSHFVHDAVAAGLLMSYGTNIADVFRQVGVYASSIIKGARPADLPVLKSVKFEFTLNPQTARSWYRRSTHSAGARRRSYRMRRHLLRRASSAVSTLQPHCDPYRVGFRTRRDNDPTGHAREKIGTLAGYS